MSENPFEGLSKEQENASEEAVSDRYDTFEQIKKEAGKKQKASFFTGMTIGLLIALCCSLAGYLFATKVKPGGAKLENYTPASTSQSDSVLTGDVEKKLHLIEDSIRDFYLDDIKDEDLEAGLYKGFVEALGDPYSTYYTREENEKLQESSLGVYKGIGAYVGYDEKVGYCYLSKIIPNTPAEEAKLRANDYLIKVDGEDMAGKSVQDAVALIKGEEGTKVLLTIAREGESDYLEIEVERRAIESPTVDFSISDDKIGFISISQFELVSVEQFTNAMTSLEEDGMKGLIIDLRGNPGGTLYSVVEIAKQLLPKGLIVYTEDKNGERKEYSCDGSHEFMLPMVVLVNENSASASEILAGAIKDYKKGTILGTKTYGKGIVQKVFNITDGSSIKLTISHYYTPNGNDIHKLGVQPDEELELDVDKYLEDGSDNQLERAYEIIKEKIK